jgi:hypothetical protein
MDRNEFLLEPHHLGVPSGASKMISEPMVLWHKPCTYLAPTVTLSPNEPKWDSTRPTSHRISSGVSKMISKPMVCMVQTVPQSCVKVSTISKWTKMSFRLSLISSDYYRVHLKRFLSLWHARRKVCTYLVSKLELSPNGPKWASTWVSSSTNSIGCIKNHFLAYGTFIEPVHSKRFLSIVCSVQTVHLSSIKTICISKHNEIRFYMTHVT